jgi:hypothetical protein
MGYNSELMSIFVLLMAFGIEYLYPYDKSKSTIIDIGNVCRKNNE